MNYSMNPKSLITQADHQWPCEQEQQRVMQCRELFLVWMVISQEGIWEEAREFIMNNLDEPTPFEWQALSR